MIYGLTLTQPWAFGFALGKRIENRDWLPRGWHDLAERQRTIQLVLHGGKFPVGKDRLEQALYDLDFLLTRVEPSNDKQCGLLNAARAMSKRVTPIQMLKRVTREGFFAYAESSSYVTEFSDLDYGSDQKQWFFGRFGWKLENYQQLSKLIPCRGALGLWQLPPDVLGQIKLALPEVFEGRR